jgi:ABC-type transporter Mla subunit MlaD
MAVVLLLPAPGALATDAAAPGTDGAEGDLVGTSGGGTELELAQQALTELQASVAELTARYDEAVADNASLQQAVDDLASERDQLAASLGHFDELYEPLEADRQLLFELRKGVPETRPEAEAQLARIRSLALSSNPSRLGQLIDRVGEAAPAFFEWRFAEFGSSEEATAAYIDSGANAFDSTMTEFRNEVLMSVANRLDGLLTVIDRIR